MLNERVRKARQYIKLSTSEIATMCGIDRKTWERYETGKNEPKPSALMVLIDRGISPEWLLTGEGSMLTTDSPAETPKTIGYPLPVSASGSRGIADQPDFVAIPRYDVEAAAGSGGTFVDQETMIGHYAFNRIWLRQRGLTVENLSVISATGDSMEPDLRDNDLLLIDHTQAHPDDGRIYIVRYSNGLYTKRVQILPGGRVDLISSNPLYKPIRLTLDEANDFDIIGRVVASVSLKEW